MKIKGCDLDLDLVTSITKEVLYNKSPTNCTMICCEEVAKYRALIVSKCLEAVCARSFGHVVEDAIREDFKVLAE